MDDVVDVYELSPMQQGMLFHALSTPGAGVDIQQIIVTLRESLDVATFEQALRDVMQRYPSMRTRFRWKDVEEPCQEVLAEAELAATVADWGDLAPEVAEQRFDAQLRADRRRDLDLSCAPMMRLFVARFPGGESRILWTFHHALLDGRSFAVVLREWFALYDAARRGEILSLPPARPYRDYIVWRRSLDLLTAEAFWRTALCTFHAPTPLAIDAQRSGDARAEPFGACQQHLSGALTEQLREAARRADVTVNTMLQAAWAVLLHRYSGESDIVFGATRAGRVPEFAEADGIVGLFINTLPMRVGVDDNAQIVPWLRSLRSQQIALRPYEHTPLAAVQAWSGVARGTPLFESLVVYDHQTIDARMQMPGRHFGYIGQTNFPLALVAYGGDEMLLRLEYSTERFSDARDRAHACPSCEPAGAAGRRGCDIRARSRSGQRRRTRRVGGRGADPDVRDAGCDVACRVRPPGRGDPGGDRAEHRHGLWARGVELRRARPPRRGGRRAPARAGCGRQPGGRSPRRTQPRRRHRHPGHPQGRRRLPAAGPGLPDRARRVHAAGCRRARWCSPNASWPASSRRCP